MASDSHKKSQKILISGATDGIGLRLLKLFCAQGASVIGTGSRPPKQLPQDWPKNARYYRADQADPDCAEKIARFVARQGWRYLDHLVLNAGSGQMISPQSESVENIIRTLSINLRSPILVSHVLHEHLQRAECGKLTLIGSLARRGNHRFATYAASKAGLAGFARALSSEWQGKIDVLLVDPGAVATAMHEKAGMPEQWFHRFFLDPDYVARCLHHQIKNHRGRKTIGHAGFALNTIANMFRPEKVH